MISTKKTVPESRKGGKKESPNTGWQKAEFITWDLTVDQRKQNKGWLLTLEEFDTVLDDVLMEGYKVTTKWDSYTNSWTAWLIPVADDHQHAGYILAGRGSTPTKAIKRAMYIHLAVFERDWAAWTTAKPREPLDD